MIVEQRIKDFERMGLGLFVHFGLYSVLGRGEWARHLVPMSADEYEGLADRFCPKPDWASDLALTARSAGFRYVTLTCRHHDGFSLYDTRGLSTFDAPHACGRDLVAEFVDACREQGLVPFFYHTLEDWHEPSCPDDWPAYLDYLQESLRLLCTNYGRVGGFWFDGIWAHPDKDWHEDELYGLVRRLQPDAILVNNTGLNARGELGNIELDSVTFERGIPQAINLADSPKYVASEMSETFGEHWGYAAEDIDYKSPADVIREIVACRRHGSNMLLNVGPRGDGLLRALDAAYLGAVGQWTAVHDVLLHEPRPTAIEVAGDKDDFLLRDGDTYYLVCTHLPMSGDPNVTPTDHPELRRDFRLDGQVESIAWLDGGDPPEYVQEGDLITVWCTPFPYGRQLVVRVAELKTR
jgi:alpha-L-fucosidase